MKETFKSLIELLDYFKEEKTCYQFLEKQIWEDGKPVCPHCNSAKVYIGKSRSKNPAKKDIPEYRCADKQCTKKFTSTVGTIFESTKISLRSWYGAIYLITSSKKGVSSLQLANQLQVTQKTAWHLLHRIREMFKETAPNMLKGIVEADETYVGGKNRNRHENKKLKLSDGRGDKTPVVGLLERNGKVLTFVVPNTTAEIIQPIMQEYCDKDCVLITDNYASYKGLANDYKHITVKHSDGNFITDRYFHTNNIENYWSIFKRGLIGIYHYVSPKHLHRYCTEFGYRYNNRSNATVENFESAVKKAAKLHLSYDKLIGHASKQTLDRKSTKFAQTPQPTGYEHLENDIDIDNFPTAE